MLALVAKEVRHHGAAALASFGLVLAATLMVLVGAMNLDAPSYLPVAADLGRLAAPALSLWWAHRLFAREHLDGTYSFLVLLPNPLWLTATLKIAMGLLMVWSSVVVSFGFVAMLASRREVVSAELLGRVLVEASAHSFAWFGLSAALVQLGRHRIPAWIIFAFFWAALASLAPNLEEQIGFYSALQGGPEGLGRSLDHHVVAAGIWGGLGVLFTLAAVSVDGGMWVSRLYIPADGWGRALSITAISGTILLVTIIDKFVSEPARSDHELLPGAGAVRFLGAEGSGIHRLAQDLSGELDRLAERTGANRVSPVVILRARHDASRPEPVTPEWQGQSLELAVDLESPNPLGPVLREVFDGPTLNPRRDRLRAGLAAYLLSSTSTMHKRAAVASGLGIGRRDLSKWRDLRLRLGADLTEAVAFVGLTTALGRCEDGRKELLLRLLLPRDISTTGLGRLWSMLVDRSEPVEVACGLSEDELLASWSRNLELLRDQFAPSTPLPSVEFRRGTVQGSGVRMVIRVDGPLPPNTELWWAVIDPLESIRPDQLELRKIGFLEVRGGFIDLPADPRSRIAATLAFLQPRIDAVVLSGWTEVHQP